MKLRPSIKLSFLSFPIYCFLPFYCLFKKKSKIRFLLLFVLKLAQNCLNWHLSLGLSLLINYFIYCWGFVFVFLQVFLFVCLLFCFFLSPQKVMSTLRKRYERLENLLQMNLCGPIKGNEIWSTHAKITLTKGSRWKEYTVAHKKMWEGC